MGKTKLQLLFAAFLLAGAMTNAAHAQWATIKSSLQPEVRIVEETATRLVLSNEALQLQLVLTKTPESDSDIYADREARRGGNPYRIWTTTELFWSKPALAEDGGKKFFTNSFTQTLRMPEHDEAPVPASEPPEQAIAKVDPAPLPTVYPDAKEEPKVVEPDSSMQSVAPVVAQAESTQNDFGIVAAPTQPARSTRLRSASGTTKPNIKPPSLETKKERALTRPNVFQPKPTMQPPVELRTESRSDSTVMTVAPAVVPAQETAQEEPVPAEVAIPQRLGSSPVLLGEIFAALILLSSFVFILTLPTTRARFLQWRGNDVAAAEIYEKKLTKSPHRVKLYLALAKIYLRMGKTDEGAMKIYKTILQLNLATHEREKFNTIVAQQYLAEGRTDSEALEIIENALKNNRNKALPDQTAQK